MKKTWPKVRLWEVMQRSTETAELKPDKEYYDITNCFWGKGAEERGSVLGAEIFTGKRFRNSSAQIIASRIDARNGFMGIIDTVCTMTIFT